MEQKKYKLPPINSVLPNSDSLWTRAHFENTPVDSDKEYFKLYSAEDKKWRNTCNENIFAYLKYLLASNEKISSSYFLLQNDISKWSNPLNINAKNLLDSIYPYKDQGILITAKEKTTGEIFFTPFGYQFFNTNILIDSKGYRNFLCSLSYIQAMRIHIASKSEEKTLVAFNKLKKDFNLDTRIQAINFNDLEKKKLISITENKLFNLTEKGKFIAEIISDLNIMNKNVSITEHGQLKFDENVILHWREINNLLYVVDETENYSIDLYYKIKSGNEFILYRKKITVDKNQFNLQNKEPQFALIVNEDKFKTKPVEAETEKEIPEQPKNPQREGLQHITTWGGFNLYKPAPKRKQLEPEQVENSQKEM